MFAAIGASFEDEAHTAEWAGFKGKKNGELLEAAEAAGYEVLLTVDQGMSRKLVACLAELYPGTTHVAHYDLPARRDTEIRTFAQSDATC